MVLKGTHESLISVFTFPIRRGAAFLCHILQPQISSSRTKYPWWALSSQRQGADYDSNRQGLTMTEMYSRLWTSKHSLAKCKRVDYTFHPNSPPPATSQGQQEHPAFSFHRLLYPSPHKSITEIMSFWNTPGLEVVSSSVTCLGRLYRLPRIKHLGDKYQLQENTISASCSLTQVSQGTWKSVVAVWITAMQTAMLITSKFLSDKKKFSWSDGAQL